MTRKLLILLVAVLALAGILSWFASPHPDGLERVAIDQQFDESAQSPAFEVLPDYTVPGIGGFMSTSIAGILGTIVVFGLVLLIGRSMRHKPPQE